MERQRHFQRNEFFVASFRRKCTLTWVPIVVLSQTNTHKHIHTHTHTKPSKRDPIEYKNIIRFLSGTIITHRKDYKHIDGCTCLANHNFQKDFSTSDFFLLLLSLILANMVTLSRYLLEENEFAVQVSSSFHDLPVIIAVIA